MGSFQIFVIRLCLAILLAILITRVFFHSTPPLRVAALAAAMLGLAYIFQYAKKRNKGG